MSDNPIKTAVWKTIEAERDGLVKLCSDLIRIPSENPPALVQPIVDFITAYLGESGVAFDVTGPDAAHPSIVAGLGEGPSLLFNGHCDVVPAGDRSQWSFDPYGGEVTPTRIRGRGASDMKCGLAGALFVLRMAVRQGLPLKGRLALHVVPDEETGGLNGTKWLLANGYAEGAFACIVAEPTSSDNCEVGQKGSVKVKLKVAGTAAHGSIGNYVGDNAIRKTIAFLSRVEELRSMTGMYAESQAEVLRNSRAKAAAALKAPGVADVIDHVTVNMGTIHGGTKLNMVADRCETELDIRVPIGLPSLRVIERLKAIRAETGLGGIEFEIVANEANYTEDRERIVRAVVSNAEKVWGQRVVPAYQWASSDARFYRENGIPTVQYGPANTIGIHSYNEDVDIEDVINSAKVYAGAVVDLLCEG
jgi:succinyl-diaminopimelate desuccinylase